MDKKIYCSAPWRGVTVREDGNVRTCCAGRTSLGNLNSASITEILEQSSVLNEIKNSLLAGDSHENCAHCTKAEDQHNYAPLRQHYLKHYPLDNLEYQLKFLDIRWNNKCNLACQYCSPMFSSVWEDRVGVPVTSPRKNYQDDLLNWILERSHQLTEIMLVGGEPMLMKQNYELLKRLPNDSRISIITNFSYDLHALPCFDDLLRRPRENVVWNISIENTKQQLEYVRNGLDWKKFINNLRSVVELWPDTVSFNMVYSMFNALELDKIISYYQSEGVKKITLMPITGQPELSAFNMPLAIREKLVEVLDNLSDWHQRTYGVDADLYPISGLESIKQGLLMPNNDVKIKAEEFYKKIDWYDSWSSTKFKDLWPDVIDLIDQHLERYV